MRHKNSPGVVLAGHKKLVAVLTKERRQFREMAATPSPAIEFRVNGPDCSVCHQPAKIIDDPMKNINVSSSRKSFYLNRNEGDHEE